MKTYSKHIGILLLFFIGMQYSCTEQDDAIPRINISIGDHQLELENYGYYAEIEASELKDGQEGKWSVLRGVNGRFEEATDPTTVFMGEPGEIYTLQWTVTENGHSESEMLDVSFKALNVSQNATFPDSVKSSFTLHLDANGTKYGAKGMWTYEGAEGAYFEEVDSCATKFVGLPNESYKLTWTVTYGSKEESSVIEVAFDSLRADAGGNQLYNIASGETLYGTLYPNHQEGASVKWTLLEGEQGVVHNPELPYSLFEGIENVVYKLRYEVSHGGQTDVDTLLYSFNKHSKWVDPSDGQEYKTVIINGLEWLAESYNLGYPNPNPDAPHVWYYGLDKYGRIETGVPVDTPELQKKYGRLYTYLAAEDLAPQGWRLPLGTELQELVDTFGGMNYAGKEMKVGGRTGLELQLGGFYQPFDHGSTGFAHSGAQEQIGYYWLKYEGADPTNALIQSMTVHADHDYTDAAITGWSYAFSVRYVREVK